MAAAEFYNGAQHSHPPPAAPSPFLAPARPQRASSNPGFNFAPQQPSPHSQPQQYFPPPPPYQDPSQKPQVHFAQSPRPQQAMPARNSFSHPQRPSPLQQDMQSSSYNPQYIPPFAPQMPAPWQQQQQQGHYSPNMRPYNVGMNQSQTSLGSGYSSDPEHHRRRHRHRHHHSDETGSRRDGSRRDRKSSDTSRGSTKDGLIGATGGGLIGDLIFPGLGTVGGALVGWIGGKDYGKHRKQREEKRAQEQERWERRYGNTKHLSPGDYDSDRDRSRSRDRRRRSHE